MLVRGGAPSCAPVAVRRLAFWSDAHGELVDAADLRPFEDLRDLPGQTVATVLRVSTHVGVKIMRDLTVEQIHTYYVFGGNTPILVHNCGDRPPNLSPEDAGRSGAFNQATRDSGIRRVGARIGLSKMSCVRQERLGRACGAASKGSQVLGGGVIIDQWRANWDPIPFGEHRCENRRHRGPRVA